MNFTGKLLISSSEMEDPNFRECVILIARHEKAGSMGVILNRTSKETLADVWEEMSVVPKSKHNSQEFLQHGGPVRGSIISIHDHEESSEWKIKDGIFYALDSDKILASASDDNHYRIFQGYSGWAAGQLEREVQHGIWMVEDADAEIVFYEQHSPDELYHAAVNKFGLNMYRRSGIEIPKGFDVSSN